MKSFLRLSVFFLTTFILLSSVFSFAAEQKSRYVIKFSHVVADSTPKGKAAIYLANSINEKLKGTVHMDVFPNSQLYDDNKVVEAMRLATSRTTGIMGAPSLSKFVKFSKELQAFDLPFLFKDINDVHRVVDTPSIAERLVKPLESKGIKGLGFWDSGMKVFSIRGSKPLINAPKDFEGKKFRIQTSDVHEAMIIALGGIPQKLPFGEVYTSLSQGVVDGQENSWSNIYSKKFHEVQDYITVSDHSYLGYLLVVSSSFWNGIPKAIRSQLEELIADATIKAREYAAEADARDIASIKAANKAKIVALPAEDKKEWKKLTASVEEKFKGEIGEGIIKEIKAVVDAK